jgi:hypothetical protein
LNERPNGRAREADIYLPKSDLRVEVKTGKHSGSSSAASFGMGNQIKDVKFEACVFLPYDARVREFLIFDREELVEVAEKPRPKLAAFPETNACLLLRYASYTDFENSIGKDALEIEKKLHKHPRMFKNRWDKILSRTKH